MRMEYLITLDENTHLAISTITELVRGRARSSRMTTSRTHCRRFSIPHWAAHRVGEGAGVEFGRLQIVAPLALHFAAALGAPLDHGDHDKVGKAGLVGKAPVRALPTDVMADQMAALRAVRSGVAPRVLGASSIPRHRFGVEDNPLSGVEATGAMRLS
jgi:hypothetical protein